MSEPRLDQPEPRDVDRDQDISDERADHWQDERLEREHDEKGESVWP